MQHCTQTFDGDATDWADGHLKRFVAVFVGFFSWQFFHGVRSSFEFGERIAAPTGADDREMALLVSSPFSVSVLSVLSVSSPSLVLVLSELLAVSAEQYFHA